jgi:hypothetical protein
VNDSAPIADWTEANQRLLVAEFARIRVRLGDDREAAGIDAELSAARAAMPAPAAIDRVVETFGLSAFERDLLLLCAGIEMDSRIAALSRKAAGRDARASVNFGLALATLDSPHWSATTPARPLRRWRLIDVEPGLLLTAAPLRIDERILHFLAGINLLDARLQGLLEPRGAPSLIAAEHEALADAISIMWARGGPPCVPVHLAGNDPSGAEDVAATVAMRLATQLMVMRADDLPSSASELDAFIGLWQREAVLLPSALLVQCGDAMPGASVNALAERNDAPLFVAAREPLRVRRAVRSYELAKPGVSEQKRLWQIALGTTGGALNGALDGAAAQFRFSARAIAAAAEVVRERAAAGEDAAAALRATCRGAGRSRLDDLAQRIPRGALWDDLVLPPPQTAALRQIAAQVRNRLRVYDDWGFGRRSLRGLGVAALFSGGSGTGKTLAAEVLASELDLDLYRIDLSSVVSKYIGETEKNLKRVFDAAEDGGAVLLFDEADALFGKRSEVKDSHDRYANIEVSYLLQRMEAYRGLAILTTNLKSALDPAFQRRLRFIVHLPFPDEGEREAIWRRAFPSSAPTAGLDFAKLARLHVAGGGIRNIALNAAFLAADEGAPVAMRHLLHAAHVESAKLERPLAEAETRGWA